MPGFKLAGDDSEHKDNVEDEDTRVRVSALECGVVFSVVNGRVRGCK